MKVRVYAIINHRFILNDKYFRPQEEKIEQTISIWKNLMRSQKKT